VWRVAGVVFISGDTVGAMGMRRGTGMNAGAGNFSMHRRSRLRRVMMTGSIVFALSAVILLAVPGFFVDLLGLPKGFGPGLLSLEWTMRMIGVAIAALAVALNILSRNAKAADLRLMALAMIVVSAAFAWLTYIAPGDMTWFRWLYVAIGAGFALAYAFAFPSRR
jgi:hypothetical protein